MIQSGWQDFSPQLSHFITSLWERGPLLLQTDISVVNLPLWDSLLSTHLIDKSVGCHDWDGQVRLLVLCLLPQYCPDFMTLILQTLSTVYRHSHLLNPGIPLPVGMMARLIASVIHVRMALKFIQQNGCVIWFGMSSLIKCLVLSAQHTERLLMWQLRKTGISWFQKKLVKVVTAQLLITFPSIACSTVEKWRSSHSKVFKFYMKAKIFKFLPCPTIC